MRRLVGSVQRVVSRRVTRYARLESSWTVLTVWYRAYRYGEVDRRVQVCIQAGYGDVFVLEFLE